MDSENRPFLKLIWPPKLLGVDVLGQQHTVEYGGAIGGQILRLAHLTNATILQHHNPIHGLETPQPVGDEEERATLEGVPQGLLHAEVRLVVQVGGALVDGHHLGVFK